MYSKEKQCGRFGKKKAIKYQKASVPEDLIQQQAEDYLEALQIRYIRIPDSFWMWLQHNAPTHIIKLLSYHFKGMPDIVAFRGIDGKVSTLMMEIKTDKGKLTQTQKKWAKELPVKISRSVDDNIKIIDEWYYG